jgi:fatty acyl-CoA reductase
LQVFKKIIKEDENIIQRIHLIKGDLRDENLGISLSDQQTLINEVDIFYHAAADVRFDENLKEAVEINVKGTRETVNLASKIHNLLVFAYVSTAFSTPSFNVKEDCKFN